ncbi:MAG: hypothetical protein JW828_00295 [Sedimentisphaerales bacterium]|nr:hypothetical protein [Sedimentisphaerales bacterium]
MAQQENTWRLNRQLNVSMLVQLFLLASLIVGSWVNLQRQLDLLQRDVDLLLERQKEYTVRVEQLQAQGLSHEYRLRAMESSR